MGTRFLQNSIMRRSFHIGYQRDKRSVLELSAGGSNPDSEEFDHKKTVCRGFPWQDDFD
jgi:hypothetical protein